MEFKILSEYLQKLESVSSRIEITKILAEVINKIETSEVDKAVYLVLGILAPGYSSITFGMAEKMVVRAIAEAYGYELKRVTEIYKETGDLGSVVSKLKEGPGSKTKSLKLSINDVYGELLGIAIDSGEESQERKVRNLANLLSKVDPNSAKYIVRIVLGKLRLGFSDKTVLDALSFLESGNKSNKKYLEESYNILPDVGVLARTVKEVGAKAATSKVKPKLGTPVMPMLAARLKSPKEMIEKMGRVYVEPKFDGLRIQIHYKKNGEVKAFTRNLRETSWMFPELLKIGNSLSCNEAILDTEAVGVDEERKLMANFQTTMGRRRKHDIEELAAKVSIKFNVFDVMYLDGESLIHTPYEERRKLLSKILKPEKESVLREVSFEETKSPERISELMQEELKEGLEGIIVKRVDSGYIAGRTGFRWVKMKEKENQKAKLADTIDAVVMGYYKGRGKRNDFGIGGFLVGIRDGDEIKTFTKIGTGLSDNQFRELKERLSGIETDQMPREYDEVAKSLVPDVWVMPELVVEVAADEITVSPIHASGYALRFPRLVKFRDDKGVEQSTSVSEVLRLFKLQKA